MGGAAEGSGDAQPWAWQQQHQQPPNAWQQVDQQPRWSPGGALGSSDTAATEVGGGEPRRPLSAFSLGEAAVTLRLTLHEKQMELLHLRAQHAALVVRGSG